MLQDKELEEERQSHKQELYETRIAEKQKIIYLSLGALFLMGFLIVVIIRNNKNKLRARAELAFKEKQIREQQAIAQGQDEERKRIAKELHDGIGGSLSMIKMKIDELNSSESNNDVGDLSEDVRRACREVRSISHNLMSVDVEGENLVEAICNFVDNLLLNTEIKVRYDLFPEKGINELDEMTKHNCYRIIQELTNNCVKHADASELSIGIILDDEGGVIRVEDNGKGFDPNTIERTGIGMKSIEQRIKAIGGQLMIEAAPGKEVLFRSVPNCNIKISAMIRVLLVDDHTMFLNGLSVLLKKEKDIELVGAVETGLLALKTIGEEQIDVLISDLSMPGMSGQELLKEIGTNHPEIRFLALSMHYDGKTISEIIELGARGYLPKDADKKELLAAIRTVASGETHFGERAKRAVLENLIPLKEQHKKESVADQLTDREKEILILIAEEHTRKKQKNYSLAPVRWCIAKES